MPAKTPTTYRIALPGRGARMYLCLAPTFRDFRFGGFTATGDTYLAHLDTLTHREDLVEYQGREAAAQGLVEYRAVTRARGYTADDAQIVPASGGQAVDLGSPRWSKLLAEAEERVKVAAPTAEKVA